MAYNNIEFGGLEFVLAVHTRTQNSDGPERVIFLKADF